MFGAKTQPWGPYRTRPFLYGLNSWIISSLSSIGCHISISKSYKKLFRNEDIKILAQWPKTCSMKSRFGQASIPRIQTCIGSFSQYWQQNCMLLCTTAHNVSNNRLDFQTRWSKWCNAQCCRGAKQLAIFSFKPDIQTMKVHQDWLYYILDSN